MECNYQVAFIGTQQSTTFQLYMTEKSTLKAIDKCKQKLSDSGLLRKGIEGEIFIGDILIEDIKVTEFNSDDTIHQIINIQ